MSKLTKVKIKAFTDKKLREKDKDYELFEIPINPENFSRSLKVEYETKKGQGSQRSNPKYTATKGEEIKLEFIFDGTGTVEGYVDTLKDLTVSKQIDKFLQTVYYMKNKIHKPKFLKLNWGENFVFDCVLTGTDISYTLFNSDGEPLRAKLSATFLDYVEQKKRVAEEDKQSPDLTHVKQVLADDTLPLMTYEIYGKVDYYTQIARVNKLTSFRNLKEGQEIIFPPVQK